MGGLAMNLLEINIIKYLLLQLMRKALSLEVSNMAYTEKKEVILYFL